MPAKGIRQVRLNIGKVVDDITGAKTTEAITRILQQGGAMADMKTPIDTGNLARSRTQPQVEGNKGHVAYTAKYAAAVHDMPGTLKGQPRADFGNAGFGGGTGVGTYWSPDAEPKFLERGFDEVKPMIPTILKAVYAIK